MATKTEELIDRSRALRKEKRFEEALIASLAATNEDPTDPDGWWQTALNRISLNDTSNSITSLRKTIEFAPRFPDAYVRLAELLQEQKGDQQGEIKKLLEKAVELGCDLLSPYKKLASIYATEKNKAQDKMEISVLEKLRSMGEKIEYNRLGILYWENKDIQNALSVWREGLSYIDTFELMFNSGLAYNHSQISKPLDAIDIWRITQNNYKDNKSVASVLVPAVNQQKEVTETIRKLGTLLLDRHHWYEVYLNPFSLLSFGIDFSDLDGLVHDPKEIIRKKKKLLAEIDLEDGKIEWLHGYIIDKSRAIAICDELLDEDKWWRHLSVYENKDLLDFLHRGSIEHFLVKNDDKAWITLDSLRDDPDFSTWLSKYFIPQFDAIFGKLIMLQDFERLKCILAGRRWIDLNDEESCFVSGRQAFSQAIKPLKDILEQAEKTKPEIDSLKNILERTSLLKISDVIPSQMRELQNELASTLRSIAIVCANTHEDLLMASEILEFAQEMDLQSSVLSSQIEDDIETIFERIAEESKYQVKLYVNNILWAIDKKGVTKGDIFIGKDRVKSVTWGIIVNGNSSQSYTLSFIGSDRSQISFEWSAYKDIEKSDEKFSNLVNATISYIAPGIVENIIRDLERGNEVLIGPLSLTSIGIYLQIKGWFSVARKLIPWQNVLKEIRGGEVKVWDRENPKISAALSMRKIPNAAIFPLIAALKKD